MEYLLLLGILVDECYEQLLLQILVKRAFSVEFIVLDKVH